MTDIPIKTRSTETFSDTPMEHTSSQSPPPTGRIADIDVNTFFEKSEWSDVSSIDSLTALSLLHCLLTRLLEYTSPRDALGSTDSADMQCSVDTGDTDANYDDSPLSLRKRRCSNYNETQVLQTVKLPTTPDLPPDEPQTDKNTLQNGNTSSSPSRINTQEAHLAKRFALTNDPGLSIGDYLDRINRYCQLSTGVYLCAAVYIHRLVVKWESVKLTNLNVHRLAIAALRLACKTIEDINHRQQFIAKMGGVNTKDLLSLEISLLFLLKFNCQVNSELLKGAVDDIKSLCYEAAENTTITN